MNLFKKLFPEALRSKVSLAILITAAVLVEATSAIQYFFAKEGIREEVQHRAETELRAKSLEIRNVTTAVEVATRNMIWAIEAQLETPDRLPDVMRSLVEMNDQIVGVGVGFVPNYYPERGRWFEPYVVKRYDGTIETSQIGSESHDYLSANWFSEGIAAGKERWSEPYYDNAGAKMMLCSYTAPIRDRSGRTVALLGADVSLDWLSAVVNANHIYPSSFNLLLSGSGQILACPVESLVMRQSIEQVTADLEDTTISHINRRMMAGESGQAIIRDANGEKNYVFYAQMNDATGWSMAVVCSDREIYHSLRQVGFNLLLLMLVGVGLLAFIILRSAHNVRRLMAVNAEKERMGNELHIASEIQKGMLPKIFPPYPERDDVEIFASLVPAKEVGGDLYDFYIRDEKLFFCIGDVSGKGVPASLVMAVTRSLFRTVTAHESSPERIVTQMNDSMAQMNDSNMFVTFFLGVLDLPTGRMRYCNAGHCPPLLVGDKVGAVPIKPNLPLGIMPEWAFEGQELLILPQTTIFLYTDGLTEAEDAAHAQFGEDRMTNEASLMGTRTPQAMLERMTAAVSTFVGDAEPSDDLTMLAIQYTKEQHDVRMACNLMLQNDIAQVTRLAEWVEGVCEAVGLDTAATMQLNLAIEEAVVNVMKYAYQPGIVGDIHIEAQADDVNLKFVITDSGTPFDPTTRAEVDTTLSAEERPIGGLGIHLVRQIMDSINYERVDGQNVLTLIKKLQQSVREPRNNSLKP